MNTQANTSGDSLNFVLESNESERKRERDKERERVIPKNACNILIIFTGVLSVFDRRIHPKSH